jgi:DNA ligase 1
MALLWKFLLAAALPVDCDLTQLPYPLWASPKIDGVRGGVQNGLVVGRKGLAPRNLAVQELVTHADMEGLDFEITVGPPWAPDVFARTNGCCNSAKLEAQEEFSKHGQFHIIDRADAHSTFAQRHKALAKAIKRWPKRVWLITQTLISDAVSLRAYKATQLDLGYEGVMLKSGTTGGYPQKPGKDNRSTLKEFYLVKLKDMERSAARVLAVHPLEHNLNSAKTATGKRSAAKAGMVVDTERFGSVTLKDTKTGAEFSVSLQSTEARTWDGWSRKELWVGKTVSYTHQLVGAKDVVPRFPQCKFAELGLGA